MPNFAKTVKAGGWLVAGALALSAGGALAGEPQVLVQQNSRTVAVKLAGLDLSSAYDRKTLDVRIDRAARVVCDVNGGSRLDEGAKATACLASARAGAHEQLARLGYDAVRDAGGAGGSL